MKHFRSVLFFALALLFALTGIFAWCKFGPTSDLANSAIGGSGMLWFCAFGIVDTLFTGISQIIQPANWMKYAFQETTELSELISSGVIDTDPVFGGLCDGGGAIIDMPYFNDLGGSSEVITDQNALGTKQLTTAQDRAVNNNRGTAWKTNDLASIFAGVGDDPNADPAKVLGDRVGAFWNRDMQHSTLAQLTGIFADGVGMESHRLDLNITSPGSATEVNFLTGNTWIDATQTLGDHQGMLTAVIMHSAVEASLRKQNLIVFIPIADSTELIRTFQGKRVILDDTMPIATVAGARRFTTYLFGRGVFAYGMSTKQANAQPEGGIGHWGAEFFRAALEGNSGLISRKRFILHPRGVKWLGASVAGPTPTDAEFAMAANWTRVWDAKKIGIVAVNHNIPE